MLQLRGQTLHHDYFCGSCDQSESTAARWLSNAFYQRNLSSSWRDSLETAQKRHDILSASSAKKGLATAVVAGHLTICFCYC
jgi:hypothetical protein